MPDYSDEGMKAWRSVLPPDIDGCLGSEGSIGSGALVRSLQATRPEDVPSILPLHVDDLTAFGRARRLRMMAWVLNKVRNDDDEEGGEATRVLADLIGEDDQGNGGSRGEATRVLYEDYLAFETSLGPRKVRAIVNADNMDAVMGAVYDAREDVMNRMGGMP